MGGLGHRVATLAREEWTFEKVDTAGISGDEDFLMDVRVVSQIHQALVELTPDYLVCTVGVNQPAGLSSAYLGTTLQDSLSTNVIGPLLLLQQFLHLGGGDRRRKFVAISSNSARIARTGSMPYCTSKAALSMGLRVAAREVATDQDVESYPLLWGYEPGLLRDTPMTQDTATQFSGPLHRMRGVAPQGLSPGHLAQRILLDLAHTSPAHHGVMFPYDAGEQ